MKNSNQKNKELVTIVSIFDLHEDFIQLQYESIKKHVKCDYEYIVFNNATSDTQREKNREVCINLGVRNIDLEPVGGHFSHIAAESLRQAFTFLGDKLVMKIDSDMFFIGDINLFQYLNKNNLFYIPTHHNSIMWSGIFGIDLRVVSEELIFFPTFGDTFCESYTLIKNPKYSRKIFELLNLQKVTEDEFVTSYNNDCLTVYSKNGEIKEVEENKLNYVESFNLKELFLDYSNLYNKLLLYNFPTDYNVDLIKIDNKSILFHFKSSNWCPWYTAQYVESKKNSLIKLLNDF